MSTAGVAGLGMNTGCVGLCLAGGDHAASQVVMGDCYFVVCAMRFYVRLIGDGGLVD